MEDNNLYLDIIYKVTRKHVSTFSQYCNLMLLQDYVNDISNLFYTLSGTITGLILHSLLPAMIVFPCCLPFSIIFCIFLGLVQYALISHWFLTWISDVKVIHNICLKLNFFLEMFVILDYTFFRNRKMPFENVIFPYLICLEDEFILSMIVYAFIVIWHYFW